MSRRPAYVLGKVEVVFLAKRGEVRAARRRIIEAVEKAWAPRASNRRTR